MRVERAYFYTLNRDPDGRGRGEKAGKPGRGCRRWYPHPGENPSARNGGWLGAVVTLSSTGDAACGLHKQRLRYTHTRARARARVHREGAEGGARRVTRSYPSSLCTASATTNNGEHLVVSRHLSRWRLGVPYTRIHEALKDAPSAKQETVPFRRPPTTDGSFVRYAPPRPSLVIPPGKTLRNITG